MDRQQLLGIREKILNEYLHRKALGDFDANSEAIRMCLETLIELVNHELEGMKSVQRKAKS